MKIALGFLLGLVVGLGAMFVVQRLHDDTGLRHGQQLLAEGHGMLGQQHEMLGAKIDRIEGKLDNIDAFLHRYANPDVTPATAK